LEDRRSLQFSHDLSSVAVPISSSCKTSGEPERILGNPEGRAKAKRRGGGDGHVGTLCRPSSRACAGSGSEDCLRQIHIAKHLGEGVDRVRRGEHKTLKAAGDDRLTGTRYDWLRHPAAMEAKDRRGFALLRNSGLKTARAWA